MHNKTNSFGIQREMQGEVGFIAHQRDAARSAGEKKGKGSGGGYAWSHRIWRQPREGTRRGGRAARSTHGDTSGRATRTKEDGSLAPAKESHVVAANLARWISVEDEVVRP